jgi:hypothetical protein
MTDQELRDQLTYHALNPGARARCAAILLALLFPLTVSDYGYCADVASPQCAVRDYWPRSVNGDGVEAYYLVSERPTRVCFVTRYTYVRAAVGKTSDCLWRDRNN